VNVNSRVGHSLKKTVFPLNNTHSRYVVVEKSYREPYDKRAFLAATKLNSCFLNFHSLSCLCTHRTVDSRILFRTSAFHQALAKYLPNALPDDDDDDGGGGGVYLEMVCEKILE
jgi:hypothetical protein